VADIKQLLAADAHREIAAGRFVIDTRFPFDYFGGRVPGSLNLPGKSIEARKGHVPSGRPLLIVAEDDELGTEISEFVVSLGFADVALLKGGIDAWLEAGYPTDTISDGIMPTPQGAKPA
jgi:rhodanese-related sulfurtransferase